MTAERWASIAVIILIMIVAPRSSGRLQRWFSNRSAIAGVSLILVCVWLAPLAPQLPAIFLSDTILTLSTGNAIVLAILTTSASLALLWLSVCKSCYLQQRLTQLRPEAIRHDISFAMGDLLLTGLVSWVSLSLAPQLFYQLYVIIIPGLPSQWVASAVNPLHMIAWLRLENPTTLSALATGALLLALFFAWLFAWMNFAFRSVKGKECIHSQANGTKCDNKRSRSIQ